MPDLKRLNIPWADFALGQTYLIPFTRLEKGDISRLRSNTSKAADRHNFKFSVELRKKAVAITRLK
jgi:hypothetical protein